MCLNGGMFVNLPDQRSSELLAGQPSSAADSPASLTVLRENVRRLVTAVISPENSSVSFGKLNPDGSCLRMSQGYAQANLDGSLESSSMTFPKWGIVSDGVAGELLTLAPVIGENGSLLLPTMTKSDCEGGIPPNNGKYRIQKDGTKWGLKLNQKIAMLPTLQVTDSHGHKYQRDPKTKKMRPTIPGIIGNNHGLKLQPAFAEWMMGFPPEWTALDASEMQLYLPKRSPSCGSSRKLKGVKSDGK